MPGVLALLVSVGGAIKVCAVAFAFPLDLTNESLVFTVCCMIVFWVFGGADAASLLHSLLPCLHLQELPDGRPT